ncbi:hypothetical protein DSL72_008687 [Monilinia vaccinii-corymbosi]|uniref:Uncharacterized protein n=1 Tax=Monilinia vaccinii-corymbosi TaxID=61207 RepID=A0A8A3PRT6_9HELO|nr:hypothetical protein DSL72_008687 [Monilinia vaccinii-corymbosi]
MPRQPTTRCTARRSQPDIPRCPGGTPKYEFRKEFLTLRPLVTEDEVKMVRGAAYKPLKTFVAVPQGTKKAVRLTHHEYCEIRDWRAANGVAPFKKPNFKSKWGWNHEDLWDRYNLDPEDPLFK